MDKEFPPYFKYWGKAKKDVNQDGADYHLLPYHCLDVAAVCYEWLYADTKLSAELSNYLGIPRAQFTSMMSMFMAMHDLGKFASAFQALFSNASSSLIFPNSRKCYDGSRYRHDRLGTWFWRKLRKQICERCTEGNGLDRRQQRYLTKPLNIIMDCMLGHHGVPVELDEPGIEGFTESQNLIAADAFAVDLIALFQPEFTEVMYLNDSEWLAKLRQVSWHIAGIAVLCDWIGSDQTDFPYVSDEIPLDVYWQNARKQAQKALESKQLIRSFKVAPFVSVENSFGFKPTPLQSWAEKVEIADTPQLFILEDVTGAGKTEAALTLTHRLMQKGVASGFYFGLPTMATSNAMYKRVTEHYLSMYESVAKKPSIVLAHGAREMNSLFQQTVITSGKDNSDYNADDKTALAECHRWLADSRKKALLAPVGVGTIDQALLAVLPKRHQSLRLLGLHNKVLIFDEVHAADEYMFELLEGLLKLHLHQGGSVILLTATLPLKQRKKLVEIWQTASRDEVILPKKTCFSDFPLATQVAPGTVNPVQEATMPSREAVSRAVKVTFLHDEASCIERIINTTESGDCVVWVRNSVDDALAAYSVLSVQMSNPDDCILFHSRFTLNDRNFIEAKVLNVFGKHAEVGTRAGKVLIATQVFQESLDADCDLMISDICPIDDLIQRAGRLHRHSRDKFGKFTPNKSDQRGQPELIVHTPHWTDNPSDEWVSKDFRNISYVYPSAGRLWLGMRELLKLGSMRMPQDARQLIEAVYSDEGREQIPASLIAQEQQVLGDERARENQAFARKLNWETGYQITNRGRWEEDEIEINTRLSEREEVQVVLLKVSEQDHLTFWCEHKQHAIQLSTLKLAKNKYADNLSPVPEKYQAQLEELQTKYPVLKSKQCWIPEQDERFGYSPVSGFYQKNIKEEL
ncbi:CRISPR-associated helicase Cas3' [Alteromonas sp. B31-7]|jgi:CRISPR-associated endonuclease/helicase Cas3|uniref:CRISPR-associated helicase Cas3' n=1 Tax=Alteromonas sp. B31-7 TaxID=2785913 RepID=UPI0018CB9827|nr:CRISPR-associated helicase Cas3' [Alteromonas sp. B31-7]QPL51007.1 CRISPR-associated helicase Cas3' [Alteromonas sp. B31-7]